MSVTKAIQAYQYTIDKLEELRELLQDKLLYLEAIDESDFVNGYYTFPKLLTKVTPEDIGSAINKQLPNKPIDQTGSFITDYKINGTLNTQYSIENFDSLLIDKFMFYRRYLMYQLENMGISKKDIDEAITIKNLILLLDKIKKVKTIDNIVCDNELVLAVNQRNYLDIIISDEDGNDVGQGTLKIYENNVCVYSENIGKSVFIEPTTVGTHTYSFEYVNVVTDANNNTTTVVEYLPSEKFDITFEVVYPSLIGKISLQNITTTSKYYNSDSMGYDIDLWNIDIDITNIDGVSINQPIPFDLYVFDNQHMVTSSTTNSTGHMSLQNINIPYCNSEFINFNEEAVTHYTYQPSSEEESELSFIKNPVFENGKITYKRITFTEDNYLTDLNGCITNIWINNNNTLEYRTFSTSQNIQLKNVSDLDFTIGDLITEIFYKTTTINNQVTITALNCNTYENIDYKYSKESPSYGIPLILKTKLNNPAYPNIEISYSIHIYHIPLKINDNCLTWYKTDPNIPSSIPIYIVDEQTGEPLSFLISGYELGINNTKYTPQSSTYNYNIDINTLPYGQTDFNVVLYKDNNIIASLNKKITLLSNFELPSKIIYYLNDTPDIYYQPKGIVAQNKQAKVNNITKYTNASGLLHDIKNDQSTGVHNLTLVAASDGLSEQRSFSYEIKKPFTITQIYYDANSRATYQIAIYDTEHMQWSSNNIPNPFNFITVKNASNNNVTYSYTASTTSTSLFYNVTIDKANNTIGTNTLSITINGYTETTTFEFEAYVPVPHHITILSAPNITSKGENYEVKVGVYDVYDNPVPNAEVKLYYEKSIDTLTLSTSSTSIFTGGSITLTATLKHNGINLANASVSFYQNNSLLGSVNTNNNGIATKTVQLNSAGTQTFYARYNTTQSESQTVTVSNSIITSSLTIGVNKSNITYGENVTISGICSAGNGKTIRLYQDNSLLTTLQTTTNGAYSYVVGNLSVGNHSFYSYFAGDSSYSSATSSTQNILVNNAGATLTINVNANSINYGESVTISGVCNAGSGKTINIYQDDTLYTSLQTTTNGSYSYTINNLSVGSHSFYAYFAGDSSYNSVTSTTQTVTVNSLESSLTINTNSSSITYGDNITISGICGAGNNQTIKIYCDNTLLTSVQTSSNGNYSYVVSNLSIGSHSFYTSFEGNGTYNPATSATQTVTVDKITTTLTISLSSSNITYGDNITISGSINLGSKSIKLYCDNNLLTNYQTASNGSYSYNVSGLSVGYHSFYAQYNGDSTHTAVTSSIETVYVNDIPNSNEYIQDISLDNNDDLVITTIIGDNINNILLVSDITLSNDGDLVVTSLTISNKNDSNLSNIVTNITFS